MLGTDESGYPAYTPSSSVFTLSPDTQYSVTVVATNSIGKSGQPYPGVYFQTPAAPTPTPTASPTPTPTASPSLSPTYSPTFFETFEWASATKVETSSAACTLDPVITWVAPDLKEDPVYSKHFWGYRVRVVDEEGNFNTERWYPDGDPSLSDEYDPAQGYT